MNILLMKGIIDSLDFFADELARGFESIGVNVRIIDVNEFNSDDSVIQEVRTFVGSDETIAIFFNHVGMFMENTSGENYWNQAHVKCFDIIVDPPVFYHDTIVSDVENVVFLCVDEEHADYINRFYKGRRKAYFLPLAGSFSCNCKPYEERTIDIAFTGNYTDYRDINPETSGLDEGLIQLWDAVYDTMVRDTSLSMVRAIELNLDKYQIILNDEQMLGITRLYKTIDSIIRSRFREKIIRTIVDAGIKIHVYGNNWNQMQCRHPENLIIHNKISYNESVQLMGNVKISLNVMPWFKRGFHDRIATAMLSGCVCVTDSSTYIDEHFEDNKNIVLYDLRNIKKLPDLLNNIIQNERDAKLIAECGRTRAMETETWTNRAKDFYSHLLCTKY